MKLFLAIMAAIVLALSAWTAQAEPAPAPSATPTPFGGTNALFELLSRTNSADATAATNILSRHTVFLNPKGTLKARFDLVCAFSTEYELVSKLAECLAGSRIKLRRQENGSFLYTNVDGDQSTIRVAYDQCADDHFCGVYILTGTRKRVDIEAVLFIQSRPGAQGDIEFDSRIFADTSSSFFDWLAKVPMVRRYLDAEAASIIRQFESVYAQIVKDPVANLARMEQFRDPKGAIYFSDKDMEHVRRFTEDHLKKEKAAASGNVVTGR